MTNPLLTEPIPRLIRRIGVPVAIGVLFNTLFQVVDTYFAGRISNEALAAMTFSFPLFFIVIGMASGMATGTSALIGNALGDGKAKEAEKIALQGLVLTIGISVLSMWVGLSSSPFLFGVLGAKGEILAYNLSYITPIFKGAVFFNLVYLFNAILASQGNTRPFRNFLILGFLLNIGLDPWFIYGGWFIPPLGVMGVAYATVIIQAIGALYLGYMALRSPLFSTRIFSSTWWRLLIPHAPTLAQILRQGLPPSLDLSTVSVGSFIVTFFISRFGTQAVAAYGIANRINQLIWLPLVGLDVATLTLVAQNNGARQFQRVWETFKTAIRYGLLLMLVMGVAVFILAGQLVAIFTDDPAIIAIGIRFIRISALALVGSPFTFIGFAALRGIKRPLVPMVISMVRMIVLPGIVLYLLISILGLGLESIWWMLAIISVLTGALSWLFVVKLMPRPEESILTSYR